MKELISLIVSYSPFCFDVTPIPNCTGLPRRRFTPPHNDDCAQPCTSLSPTFCPHSCQPAPPTCHPELVSGSNQGSMNTGGLTSLIPHYTPQILKQVQDDRGRVQDDREVDRRDDSGAHSRHCEGVSPWQSSATGRMGRSMATRCKGDIKTTNQGFSLIELLVSLIIISLITTFLAPVLTKKIKYQNATISSNPPSLDCAKFDTEARCLMCNKTCTLCTTQLEQLEGKFVYPPLGCDYKDCSTGCKKCDFKSCIACYEGYGFDLSTKTCLKCRSDEYSLGGIEVCKKCPTNCLACKNETKCTACRELYNLNNGKCELGNCAKVDNICVARFNAGDSGGLNIPAGLVEIRGTASTAFGGEKWHSLPICWRGATASSCNSNNGGYSGCTRTVCTWAAADKICAYNGWRLPTSDELKKFNAYSANKGMEGLQLCAGSGNAACSLVTNCSGSYNNNCDPQYVWSSTRGVYGYISGLNMLISSYPESHAMSVRCVRNL